MDEQWKSETPPTLLAPIEHIRTTFDEGVWKCSEATEKLCFAGLHPYDERAGLDIYIALFENYKAIIGPEFAQQFDHSLQVGTPPAIFHAFLGALAAGIRTEVFRLFNDLLEIGIAHVTELREHPVDFAKMHLATLINGNRHVLTMWIKQVCDKQDFTRALGTEEEADEFIFWKGWRAPKLIYMQPSGNLLYDPSTVWEREDEATTKELLGGLSNRLIHSLGFYLDKVAGDAHIRIAKTPGMATVLKDAPPGRDKEKGKSKWPPTAFISYSWDTLRHKEWVLELARRLQGEGGVKIVLDQWYLRPGQDKTVFMERSVKGSDFVILICTPNYAERANRRAGGVGYEAMIITGELAEQIDSEKFIPVLREGDWPSSLPTWIKTRLGVDLRANSFSGEDFNELLRTLHGVAVEIPPIGPKPPLARDRDSQGPPPIAEIQRKEARNATEKSSTETKGNEEKANAIAFAHYETKGANSMRAEAYVRPSAQAEGLFRFENSFGEVRHGTMEEVGIRFTAFDKSLLVKGYVRIRSGNLSGKHAFDL